MAVTYRYYEFNLPSKMNIKCLKVGGDVSHHLPETRSMLALILENKLHIFKKRMALQE